jgi:serine/threonine protein phosphatase PrpC
VLGFIYLNGLESKERRIFVCETLDYSIRMGSCNQKNSATIESILPAVVPKPSTPNFSSPPLSIPPAETPAQNIFPPLRSSDKHLTLVSNPDSALEPGILLPLNTPPPAIELLSQNEQGDLFIAPKSLVKIEGSPSPSSQSAFADKLIKVTGEETKASILDRLDIWVCCKKGLKPDAPNQDDFTIVIDGDSYLLGVFDGHGVYGHCISNFVHSSLPSLFFSNPNWPSTPQDCLSEGFLKCQQQLIREAGSKSSGFDCHMSGSTATIVYKRNNTLHLAHVGDSRAILGRRTDLGFTPIVLTIDHRPDLFYEKTRIEAAGGEVRCRSVGGPMRVFFKNKEYPGISMSRAFGDTVAATIGIVCMPETSQVEIKDNDEFLVVCSDGVWEFVSDEEAVRVVGTSNRNAKEAANRLAALAWTKWISNEGNTVDDITVIVAYFPVKDDSF